MNQKDNIFQLLGQHYKSILINILFLLFISGDFQGVYAQQLTGSEYQVKAGFIYNFLKFTQWPPEQDSETQIVMCIDSDKEETDILWFLDGKIIRDKTVVIKKLLPTNLPDKCNIIFITSNNNEHIQTRLRQISQYYGLLSVGESQDFIRQGGVINFFIDNNKLRFGISLENAKKMGLKFGSQLLMSAEISDKN